MKNYSREQILEFLDEIENQLEDIYFEREESEWNQYLGNSFTNPSDIDKKQYNLLGNKNLLDLAEEWKSKSLEEVVYRRFELLKKVIIETLINNNDEISNLKTKIETKLISNKPVLSGKEVSRSDIANILKNEKNRNTRFEAFKAESETAKGIKDDLLELILLRNKYAKTFNYNNYAELRLSLNDIDSGKLNKHFDDILSATSKVWMGIISQCKENQKIDKIYPWDIEHYIYGNLFSISPNHFPEASMLKSFYNLIADLGIDKNKLPILIKYQDIPYPGLCFPFKIAKDVRILVNPRDGFDWYRIFYHEHGHAIHFSMINQPTCLLQTKEPYHFMESMAILFESFITSKVWLKKFLKDDALMINVKKQNAFIKMYKLRSWIAFIKFEFELYKNPSQNLSEVFNKIYSETLCIDQTDIFAWESKAMYTTYPVYFQNYVLAELISAHIIGYYKSDGASIIHPDFYNFIKKYFYEPGASLSWSDKVKIGTSSEITSSGLVDQLLRYEEN